jgi:hypothetical protein
MTGFFFVVEAEAGAFCISPYAKNYFHQNAPASASSPTEMPVIPNEGLRSRTK